MEFKDVLKEVFDAVNEILENDYECCGEQILSVALDLYKFKVEQERKNNKPAWQQYYPPNKVTVVPAGPAIKPYIGDCPDLAPYIGDRPDLAPYIGDTIESIKGPTCTL